MDLFELQKMFTNMYPTKTIEYEFDIKCIRSFERIATDGILNVESYCEYNKVRVDIQGMDSIYATIKPHRANILIEGIDSIFENIQPIKVVIPEDNTLMSL